MIFKSCSREKEVSALLIRGQWPDACAAELRSHVADCRNCSDLVLVMGSFQSARSVAIADANPGSAGALWWRAQLRRRKTAVERVGRPILGAQIFAFSITLLVGAGFLVSQARHGLAWLSWLKQVSASQAFRLDDLLNSALSIPAWELTLLGVGLAAVALLSGVVLYLDRQGR